MGNEEFPVQYYEVIEGNTITKKNGWWEAVVRYRKPYSNSEDQEVALYKWKRDTDKEKWIRKQKYAFRNRKDWLAVGDCVENMFSRM